MSSLTASTVVYVDANKKFVSSSVTPTQLSYLDATSSIQTQLNGKQASGSYLTSSSPSITSPTIATSLTASYATASTIAGFDASKNLITLATTTYPSLTELAYVKGVTSAIQSQLDSKQASGSYITASSTDTLTNKTLTRYLETIATPAISAGTLTIDCSANNNFWVTHNANITTFAFSNVPASGTQYTANVILTQDATGTRTFPITATTSVYKVMGATIALNTAANAINTLTFVTKDGGTTWLVYFNKVS